MKERKQLVPLIEIIEKPQFVDIHGLRKYLISILDESEKRNGLDFQGVPNVKKSRKKSLSLGWKEGGFARRLFIEESKDKETVSVGFELQCLKTKNKYITEKYKIFSRKPEDPTEDLLYFTYTNNFDNPQNNIFLNINETKTGLRKIKEKLFRAIEFNCI